MTLRQLLPEQRVISADALDGYASELAEPGDLVAFDPDVLAFCSRLSAELRRSAGAAPELAALAFWLRPAALARLREEIEGQTPPAARVPRGVVLAIPPANVDTVFAYTWLLSLLLGNRTVLRVPSRAGAGRGVLRDGGGGGGGAAGPRGAPATRVVAPRPVLRVPARAGAGLGVLLDCMGRALEAAGPRVAQATVVVAYGHDDEITARLSAACDLRIVWGGDDTVRALRAVPLPASARELSFGHRTALAVLSAEQVASLDDAGLAELARHFVADAYSFEQRACSSPRAVIWFGGGGDSDSADAPEVGAHARFWAAIRTELDRRSERSESDGSPAAGLDALALACDLAAEREAVRIAGSGTDLTVVGGVELAGDSDGWRSRHTGGGLFAEVVVDDLTAVPGLVVRRDQTLTTFGVDRTGLTWLAEQAGRRGVDRVVPVGSALTFSRWWDGVDLVAELTRLVHRPLPATRVPAARAHAGVRPSAGP